MPRPSGALSPPVSGLLSSTANASTKALVRDYFVALLTNAYGAAVFRSLWEESAVRQLVWSKLTAIQVDAPKSGAPDRLDDGNEDSLAVRWVATLGRAKLIGASG